MTVRPPSRTVVLVGGGHAHALVLRQAMRRPIEGRLTLVTDRRHAPYSGMLPGWIAGHYETREMHIDLSTLAVAAGAEMVLGTAVGLDRDARQVLLQDGRSVPYGIVSFDVGSAPDLSGIRGARDHALSVKPIARFGDRFRDLCDAVAEGRGPRRIVVIGGGPAGVELAFALHKRFVDARREIGLDASGLAVTLVPGDELLPGLSDGVRRRAAVALKTRGIHVIDGRKAIAVGPQSVEVEGGLVMPADVVVVATGARAAEATAGVDLPRADDGAIRVRATLQSLADDDVFAVGDCAHFEPDPLPKAGVHAVRQGPVLADNLARRLDGEELRDYEPQEDFLVLMSTADGRAIGGRGPRFAVAGRWVWWWKDWIDRAFMAQFPSGG